MNLSTGYEPTTGNTLPAAVTDVGNMDVDIPYGGGTGSFGGPVTLAPTTPPPKPNPIQSIMPAAVVHHGAPLSAAPFYGGGGAALATTTPTGLNAPSDHGSYSQSNTSNQVIPLQVNVNMPNHGSPGKIELQNEIMLLKQQMHYLNFELYQAQIKAAESCGQDSEFKARAKVIVERFESTAAEAKAMWGEAHEVAMGQQKAECQKEFIQFRNEAQAHVAKLTEKLETTQRQAREIQVTSQQEFQAKSQRLQAEMHRREEEMTKLAKAEIEMQKGSHNVEVQAKNLEIQRNILRLNEMQNQMKAREQQVQTTLQEANQQTELQRQALQETLTAKQSLEINAHQLSVTCETERGARNNETSHLQSIIDKQAETVKQFQQRDQDQISAMNELYNQNARIEAQREQDKQTLALEFQNQLAKIQVSDIPAKQEGVEHANGQLQTQLDELIRENAEMQNRMNAAAASKKERSEAKRTVTYEINTPPEVSPTIEELSQESSQEDSSSKDSSSEDPSDEDESDSHTKPKEKKKRNGVDGTKKNPQRVPQPPEGATDEEKKKSEAHEKQKREFRELFPPEGRKRSRDTPKAHEAESVSFEGWPSHRKEKTWRFNAFRNIATASVHPNNCLKWLKLIQKAASIEDLPETPAIFEQLETKILKAGIKCCKGTFKDDIMTLIHKAEDDDEDPHVLPGSQVLWRMLKEMKRTIPEQTATSYREILHVKLKNNDMNKFIQAWTRCLEDAIIAPPGGFAHHAIYRRNREMRTLSGTLEACHIATNCCQPGTNIHVCKRCCYTLD